MLEELTLYEHQKPTGINVGDSPFGILQTAQARTSALIVSQLWAHFQDVLLAILQID